MDTSSKVAAEYARRAADRKTVAQREQRRFRVLGNLRLASAVSAVSLAFFVFGAAQINPAWLCLPAGLFLIFVAAHAKVVQSLEAATRSARFYEQGLARVENRWMGTGEQGVRFRDPNHVYAEDLDLFGKGSLFELLCTARTQAGEDALAQWLLAPAPPEDAARRQRSVAELAPRLDLRESLALIGEDIRAGVHPELLAGWGASPPVSFPAILPWAAGLLSASTILTLTGYLTGITGRIPLLVSILSQLLVAYSVRQRVQQVVTGAELVSGDLTLLSQLLNLIEAEPSESPKLRELKARLETAGLPASGQIAKLVRLATMREWTGNEFFKPIASILMWSTQLAVAIERWRQHCGGAVAEWIRVAGEFEALCALAGYLHEHPADPFPELSETGPLFDGEGLGHPLLAEANAVRNDIRLSAGAPLFVVSGSNMSGKSTLLRTVGLNAVLAWAGGPVRAKRLSISPLRVGASIRVQDSLQDGRSRFYAEITRLRQVLELTAGGLPVLFLLDELLSGTNSHDRRIGAAAIIESLVERGAIGLLTTHDLALAHIADTVRGAANVHFADTIDEGRLHFDYKLMPGVVERSNALELMRSVGLPV